MEAVQLEEVHPSQVRQCLAASVLGGPSRQEVQFAVYPSVVGLDKLVGLMEEVHQVVVGPSGAGPSEAEPSGAEPFVEVEQVGAALMEGAHLVEEVQQEVVPLREDLFEEMRLDPVVDILGVDMRYLEHLA